MSSSEIDAYLQTVPEPQRSTLEQLRTDIRALIPEAEEGMAYRLPAYRIRGKVVAGFAAFKNHLSYIPHSGSVLSQFPGELADYKGTKSSLHFANDRPLPKSLLKKLIDAKRNQLGV
jgi:uncharacterized protein YdhG (YjbR/CyaY superfamily)